MFSAINLIGYTEWAFTHNRIVIRSAIAKSGFSPLFAEYV